MSTTQKIYRIYVRSGDSSEDVRLVVAPHAVDALDIYLGNVADPGEQELSISKIAESATTDTTRLFKETLHCS